MVLGKNINVERFSWFPEASWWMRLYELNYRPIAFVDASHLKKIADLALLQMLDAAERSGVFANAWVRRQLGLQEMHWSFDSWVERLLFLRKDQRFRLIRLATMRLLAPSVRRIVRSADRYAAVALLGQADYNWMLACVERYPEPEFTVEVVVEDLPRQFRELQRALWGVVYRQLPLPLAQRFVLQLPVSEMNAVVHAKDRALAALECEALLRPMIVQEIDPELAQCF